MDLLYIKIIRQKLAVLLMIDFNIMFFGVSETFRAAPLDSFFFSMKCQSAL